MSGIDKITKIFHKMEFQLLIVALLPQCLLIFIIINYTNYSNTESFNQIQKFSDNMYDQVINMIQIQNNATQLMLFTAVQRQIWILTIQRGMMNKILEGNLIINDKFRKPVLNIQQTYYQIGDPHLLSLFKNNGSYLITSWNQQNSLVEEGLNKLSQDQLRNQSLIDFIQKAALCANRQTQNSISSVKLTIKSYFSAFNSDGMYIGTGANMTYENYTEPPLCPPNKYKLDTRCQEFFDLQLLKPQQILQGYPPLRINFSDNNRPFTGMGICKKIYTPASFNKYYKNFISPNMTIFSIICNTVYLQKGNINFSELGNDEAVNIITDTRLFRVAYQNNFQMQPNQIYTLNDTYLNRLEPEQKSYFLRQLTNFSQNLKSVCSTDKDKIFSLQSKKLTDEFQFKYGNKQMIANLQLLVNIDKNRQLNNTEEYMYCTNKNLFLITIVSMNQIQSSAIALREQIIQLGLIFQTFMYCSLAFSILITLFYSIRIANMLNKSIVHLTNILNQLRVDEDKKNIILFEEGIFNYDFEIDYSQVFQSSDMHLLYQSFQNLFQTLIFTTQNLFGSDESQSLIELTCQVSYFSQFKNYRALGIIYNNIGNLHFNNSRFTEALENYGQSIICCKYEMNEYEYKQHYLFNNKYKMQQTKSDQHFLQNFIKKNGNDEQITEESNHNNLLSKIKSIFYSSNKKIQIQNRIKQQNLAFNLKRENLIHLMQQEQQELNQMLFNRKYNFLLALVSYSISNQNKVNLWELTNELIQELKFLIQQNESLKIKMNIILNCLQVFFSQFNFQINDIEEKIKYNLTLYDQIQNSQIKKSQKIEQNHQDQEHNFIKNPNTALIQQNSNQNETNSFLIKKTETTKNSVFICKNQFQKMRKQNSSNSNYSPKQYQKNQIKNLNQRNDSFNQLFNDQMQKNSTKKNNDISNRNKSITQIDNYTKKSKTKNNNFILMNFESQNYKSKNTDISPINQNIIQEQKKYSDKENSKKQQNSKKGLNNQLNNQKFQQKYLGDFNNKQINNDQKINDLTDFTPVQKDKNLSFYKQKNNSLYQKDKNSNVYSQNSSSERFSQDLQKSYFSDYKSYLLYRRQTSLNCDGLSKKLYVDGLGEDKNNYDIKDEMVYGYIQEQIAISYLIQNKYKSAAEIITQMYENSKLIIPFLFNRSFKKLLFIFETFQLNYPLLDKIYQTLNTEISFQINVVYIDWEKNNPKENKLFQILEQQEKQTQKDVIVNLCLDIVEQVTRKQNDYFGFIYSNFSHMQITQKISLMNQLELKKKAIYQEILDTLNPFNFTKNNSIQYQNKLNYYDSIQPTKIQSELNNKQSKNNQIPIVNKQIKRFNSHFFPQSPLQIQNDEIEYYEQDEFTNGQDEQKYSPINQNIYNTKDYSQIIYDTDLSQTRNKSLQMNSSQMQFINKKYIFNNQENSPLKNMHQTFTEFQDLNQNQTNETSVYDKNMNQISMKKNNLYQFQSNFQIKLMSKQNEELKNQLSNNDQQIYLEGALDSQLKEEKNESQKVLFQEQLSHINKKKKELFYFSIRKAICEIVAKQESNPMYLHLSKLTILKQNEKEKQHYQMSLSSEKKEFMNNLIDNTKVAKNNYKKIIVVITSDLKMINPNDTEYIILHNNLQFFQIELCILIQDEHISTQENQIFQKSETSLIQYFFSETSLQKYLINKRCTQYHSYHPLIVEHF